MHAIMKTRHARCKKGREMRTGEQAGARVQQKAKRRLAALATALMLMLPALPAPALAEVASPTAAAEKTEIVYASLSATGAVQGAYVVNRFDVSAPGLLVDFGAYTYGKNLTSGEDISFVDGATMVNVEEGTFYYQGNTDAIALPWDVSFSYALDGQPVAPDELAGASGSLSIQGTTTRNDQVSPTFFESFVLQVTFTLPGDACTHVVAEGATIAQSGSNQTVAFTVLPNHDGAFALTADVEDFEMPGVQIVALPYVSPVKMPDTSGMTDGLEQLSSGVGKLADGATSLASGARELSGGAQDLSQGMTAVGDGLEQLGTTGEELNAGASAMGSAIGAQSEALSEMSQSVGAALAASGDPQLQAAAEALAQMAGGMAQLDAQYGQFQEGLAQYAGGTSALAGQFGQLEEGASGLASGASQLASGADELASGAATMRRETARMPAQMQGEIDKMTADFDFPEFVPTSFMSPQNASVKSVQFVLTTAAIEVPEQEQPEEEVAAEETIVDRFLALFGL